jgi:hypothetical protein
MCMQLLVSRFQQTYTATKNFDLQASVIDVAQTTKAVASFAIKKFIQF